MANIERQIGVAGAKGAFRLARTPHSDAKNPAAGSQALVKQVGHQMAFEHGVQDKR